MKDYIKNINIRLLKNEKWHYFHTTCLVSKLKYYSLIVLISFIFLLLFSTATSPLYKNYWLFGDGGIFMLVGKSFLNGKMLYSGIFETKGPVLFFIQVVGQLIMKGKYGIFIIQILNMSIVLLFLRKIALLFCSPKQTWGVIMLSLMFLGSVLDEGNRNEEFSLVFLVIPLYLVLQDFMVKRFILKHTFIYGICFALVSFIKLSNAAMLGALVFTIGTFLIIDGKWKLLFKHIGLFLLGILIVSGIISTYFLANNAFKEMIDGTFLWNFLYTSTGNFKIGFSVIYSVLISLFAIIVAYRYYKLYKNRILLVFIIAFAIFDLIAVNLVRSSGLYQILNMPLVTLIISIFFYIYSRFECKKCKISLMIEFFTLYFLPMLFLLTVSCKHLVYLRTESPENLYNKIPKYKIPDSEKSNVIGYNAPATWYLHEDITPCYKYAFLQEHWAGKITQEVKDDFNSFMLNEKPLWLLTTTEIHNPTLTNIISRYYIEKDKTDDYILYRLKK
ncbi:MAG: hypothetical protein LBR17_04000 [Bacteroidales bacterium]|jgi:hypothetical protein|nr:hypothetical protein [Bacteroidales bacterium]